MAKHLFISDNLLASKQASKQASKCLYKRKRVWAHGAARHEGGASRLGWENK